MGKDYEQAIQKGKKILNEQIKRCSTLLVNTEMQIQAIGKYHLTFFTLAKIKNLTVF